MTFLKQELSSTDFVSLKGTRNVNPFRKFSVSQKVRLSMQLPHKKKLHCLGKIRRISSKNGRYPDGIGVQFDHLNLQNVDT
ncbi:MAG: PilZ domain-containing protein [Bdellovibrionota bacterium]